jgi:predicted RNA binding protein YcfA (HicA-like mRNA interferase family)
VAAASNSSGVKMPTKIKELIALLEADGWKLVRTKKK